MQFIPYGQQIPIGMGNMMNPPVPTIGSINNGYNYNYYNQYYNPQYIRQQQEQQRELLKRQRDNQIDIYLKLVKCNSSYDNEDIDEDELRNKFNELIKINSQNLQDCKFMDKVHDISEKCHENLIKRMNSKPVQYVNQQSEDKSFYRWLHEDAQERFDEMIDYKVARQRHNTSQLYNSSGYNQVLRTHEGMYNSLMPGVTVDDMEVGVSLPEKLRNERDVRRNIFIQSILNNGGINNG